MAKKLKLSEEKPSPKFEAVKSLIDIEINLYKRAINEGEKNTNYPKFINYELERLKRVADTEQKKLIVESIQRELCELEKQAGDTLCASCGETIPIDSKYCAKCGAKTDSEKSPI